MANATILDPLLPLDPPRDVPRAVVAPADAPLDPLSQPGAARYAAQAGSYGLRGALGSAGTLLGDLPNALFRGLDATVGRYLVDPLANAVFGPPRQTGEQPQSYVQRARETVEANPQLPTSANLIGAAERSGLVNRPELVPRTTGEHYLTAGAEGAGSALPFLPLAGGGGPVAAVGRTLLSGAGGGAAGEGAARSVEGTSLEPYAPYLRVAGNVAGGLGGNALASGIERGIGAWRNLGPALEAYRTAGVTPRMVGDVTGSAIGQAAQGMSERAVGGAGRLQTAARQTLDEWQASLERAVDDLGGARTPTEAGTVVQNTADTWLGNWRQASTAAWNRLFTHLPPDQAIPIDQTRTAINALGQRMHDVPEVAAAMQGDQFARLRDAINASSGQWRSESVRTLRSIVGDLIDTANIGGNIPQAELRQLYAALSADVRTAVAMRPGGLAAWDAANEVTRTGHAIIDRTVSNLTRPMPGGGNAINPETAFGWVTGQMSQRGGGATRLNEVRNVMEQTTPDSFGNVGSAVLSRAATDVANTSNPASALNLLGTRGVSLSQEARDILLGQAGQGPRARIDALTDLANRMRATQRLANPSGTAGTAANLDWLRDVGTLTGGVGGLLAGGGGAEAAVGGLLGRVIAGPVLGRAVAGAATSPLVARLAAAPTSNPGATGMLLQQALGQAAISPAARARLFPSGDRRQ